MKLHENRSHFPGERYCVVSAVMEGFGGLRLPLVFLAEIMKQEPEASVFSLFF